MTDQKNNNEYPIFVFDDTRVGDITERYFAGEISDDELLELLSER